MLRSKHTWPHVLTALALLVLCVSDAASQTGGKTARQTCRLPEESAVAA